MEAVLEDMDHHVPLWNAILDGKPDWNSTYAGFSNAVDWPTATFFRELNTAHPEAKFVLTYRDPAVWAESFGSTIYTALAGAEQAPPSVRDWLHMATRVVERAGFPLGMTREQLAVAFEAHNAAVRDVIPAERLLEFQVKEGWRPLCEFLDLPVPATPFPRTNNREEFWEIVGGAGA